MKKLLLLLVGGGLAVGANAQYANHSLLNTADQKRTVTPKSEARGFVPMPHSDYRTSAVTFYTQDFAGGLPAGWSVGNTGGGNWHWTTVASTSAYALPAMASTSAANGWMMYDSDSLGTACSCAPKGWLQSAVINCSTHPSVRLNFQNYYRSFNDSCSIWVGTNAAFTAGTYQVFPVLANDGLATNVASANASTIHMNISSVAGGAAAVYIRFVYYGASGGSYSWNVDDMSLSELDPHDVGISGGFTYDPDPSAYNGSMFATPMAFVDSIFPVTLLTNYGANTESNVVVNANIYQGTSGTPVFTQAYTYTSLPVNSLDTIIQFNAYKPTAIANYTCAFDATVTGDADATNGKDTVKFSVTDTTYMQNAGQFSGSYYLRKNTGGAATFMQGTRFDVSSNCVGDTVSGFGVAFSSSSVPTGAGLVSVQLYSVQATGTGWTYCGTSVARSLTATDISTGTASLVWADFRIDQVASGGVTPFVLTPGTTYAAMIQIKNVTTDLLVYATVAANATGFAGYFGQGDTSLNDGLPSFSPTSIATGNASATPLVRLYTGSVHSVAVTDVAVNNMVGKAFPNPANTSVTVPFTTGRDADVTVSLTNVIGQVVRTQNIHAIGGQSAKATFATGDLAAGVYVYTVEANGQKSTGRIAVTH